MAGQVWAYARVSTRDQNPQLQLDALGASGYDTLVQEQESAKRGAFRPAWQELLPLPQPGDTLKFWKSDRWGRSAADVLATVNELRDRGIKVVATRYAQWRQRRAPMSSREEPFSAPVT